MDSKLIVEPNGHHYTTAAEEIRTKEIRQELMRFLRIRLREAMKAYRGGKNFVVDFEGVGQFIDQAYFMGRNDG